MTQTMAFMIKAALWRQMKFAVFPRNSFMKFPLPFLSLAPLFFDDVNIDQIHAYDIKQCFQGKIFFL